MVKNIQDKLNSAQASAFAQLATKPVTLESFSEGLKNSIAKVGLMSFVAASIFMASMGNAEAGSQSNSFKVAAGISALIGVANNNNHALNLPGVCDIRGVNGVKVAASTFLGSAVGSQLGGGNGTKAWMAALGLLGTNMSLNSENDRIYKEMQECERKLAEINNIHGYNNVNLQVPQYLIETDPRSIIFYSFPDKKGQQTMMTWETSPSIKSFEGKGKGTDVNKNEKASNEFNSALNQLHNARHQFEVISNQWIELANSKNQIDSALKMRGNYEEKKELREADQKTREVMVQASQAFEMAYQNYILTRGGFIALADAQVLEGFNLKEHKATLDLLQLPQSAKMACQCNLQESYNKLDNQITDRVKKRIY